MKISVAVSRVATAKRSLASAASRWTGLGDLIHAVAGDGLLAKAAEFVAGTLFRRASCGCIQRVSRLNSRVPFKPAKLAVCIPHRNDLEGLWATLLSIRDEFLSTPHIWFMGQRWPLKDVLTVVIVNQRTGHTVGGERTVDADAVARSLEGFAAAIRRCGISVVVEHQPAPHGSARAKQECAKQAAKLGAEWCLICDSHVHFIASSLIRTVKWLQRHANRNSRDLFYGFLVNDHMTPQFKGGKLVAANGYTGLNPWDTVTGLPHVGGDSLWGRWSDAVIYAHVLYARLPDDLKKLIPAEHLQGDQFFVPVCVPAIARKVEAIVGANLVIAPMPDATVLLDFVVALLNSQKPNNGGLALSQARREQVVAGLADLMTNVWPTSFEIEASGGWMVLTRVDQAVPSLDTINQRVRHPSLYFPEMGGFGGEESIVALARRENGYSVKCLTILAAYHRFMRTNLRTTYGSSWEDACRNHMIAAHKLGETLAPKLAQQKGAVLPSDLFVAAYIRSGKPEQRVREIQRQVVGQIAGVVQAETAALPPVPPDKAPEAATVFERFTELKAKPSDINEHLQTLFDLAYQFEHVTEFGTRHGVSTTALLAAQPKVLISYDTQKTCSCKGLEQLKGETDLQLRQGPEFDTATMSPIAPTDMLLVDTLHTAEHVFAELSRHSASVRHVIVLHDTEAPWGSQDEGGGTGGGVRAGISRWLATPEGSMWLLEAEFKHNHGLHVYRRRAV